MYNLEYRILDKLGRTKKTLHGGVFLLETSLDFAKERILKNYPKQKITFDVYILDEPVFKTLYAK